MGKIKVIRVVFSILLVQLLTLSVNADEKADYLKLAQKVRQEVWSSTPADFQNERFPTDTRMLRPSYYLIIGS